MNDLQPYFKKLIHVYKSMLLARTCDETELSLIRQGCGKFHVGGQGAEVNAIIHIFLDECDGLYLHWRDRALRIARGITVDEIAANFFTTSGSEGHGRSLTCHESSVERNIFPLSTPVPSHCLPACGIAWDNVLSSCGTQEVAGITVCTLGDGSTRQGEFLEALAFSLEMKLPVLFIVIDNDYAISTRTTGKTAYDLGLIPEGILSYCDGTSPQSVFDCYFKAIQNMRENIFPEVVVLKVPRLFSHTSNDEQSIYRSSEELRECYSKDPLPKYEEWLIDIEATTLEQLELMKKDCREEVSRIYEGYSKDSKNSKVSSSPIRNSEVHDYFVKENPDLKNPVDTRIRDSVNNSLDHILSNNPQAILMGEDIEDPLGGVFRLTQGLSSKYKTRVINAPLAEASILGVGSGLAMVGRLAILEIQFIDFIAPGWNQLVTNIATQFWRTCGSWKMPLIIYAPADGYCPGEGIWHSQINASLFARNTGLYVVMPSNPLDVWESFTNAAELNEPTIILLPKAQLWSKFSNQDLEDLKTRTPKPFSARVIESGTEVSVVCWGNSVSLTKQAMTKLPDISIDLLDIRYLNPIDFKSIYSSASKTRKLLIIDSEHDGPSLGNYIASRVFQNIESVNIELLHRRSQYLGCSELHESDSLIYANDIILKIKKLLYN